MHRPPRISNLLADIPDNLPEELIQEILSSDHVKIERIISCGHRSPDQYWYDQQWDEWVLLVRGKAGIVFDDDPAVIELTPGDYLLIPAHKRHRVAWTDNAEDTIWLVVHIRPRKINTEKNIKYL